MQVYNVRQAKQDIDAVYSMGLFDDVNILPQPSEDSTLEQPKVHPAGACKELWRLLPPAFTAAEQLSSIYPCCSANYRSCLALLNNSTQGRSSHHP